MSNRTAPRLPKTEPRRATPPMVEVAPNRWVQTDLQLPMPETVFCDLEPLPGHPGAYRLEPRSWERLARVTTDLCDKLGLGPETFTLRRLIRSGFVDGARVSPRVYNVNIASFFRHMKRCSEDPDFWENKEQKAQFLTACR